MALPRSATKALKLWPWKDIEGAPGMREHKQRNGSMASFGPPTGVTEEYKLGKSEVAEVRIQLPLFLYCVLISDSYVPRMRSTYPFLGRPPSSSRNAMGRRTDQGTGRGKTLPPRARSLLSLSPSHKRLMSPLAQIPLQAPTYRRLLIRTLQNTSSFPHIPPRLPRRSIMFS
ncbi:hypothetical protein BDV93DRAFT_518855 [Ceratobasidium sp. AG-I]|nr:hypothetical protein BDV93DRAFT_518855 [Ceratobasidium sp. AG-I]